MTSTVVMSGVANERSLIRPYRRYPPGTQPIRNYDPYKSTVTRNPRQPLIVLLHTLSEVTGPVYGHSPIAETDNDLTRPHTGEPQGQRIIVTSKVLDDTGDPVPDTSIEIWQSTPPGLYPQQLDQ